MEAELILSRMAYRAGTPVVGSVRIRCAGASTDKSIRSKVASARLYLTGQAHLRPGSSSWRSSKEISTLKSLYGEHACLTFASLQERSGHDREFTLIEKADRIALQMRMHKQQEFRSTLPLEEPNREEDVICFWMTNVLDLMDVPENDMGEQLCLSTDARNPNKTNIPNAARYELSRTPLQLPDHNTLCRVLNTRQDALNETFEVDSIESSDEDSNSIDSEKSMTAADPTIKDDSNWERIMASSGTQPNSTTQYLEWEDKKQLLDSQIAITFRSNLPEDAPATLSAECVKYFYSAVLVVTTEDEEVIIFNCPFTVLTRNTSNSIARPQPNNTSHTRVHIGELYAIAHSSSLPLKISPIEALGDKQLHVISDPPACNFVSRMTAERRTSTHRIQNEKGALCAWLTLVGIGGVLTPGMRFGLIVRFPSVDEDVGHAGTVACHRVCCALIGEEYALCEGVVVSSASSLGSSNKRKTRSYVFDSSYEMVDCEYTNSISMELLLPLDCPITVKTDLVEVAVSLKLEFTVDRAGTEQSKDENNADNEIGFGFICLELPVEVVHDDEMAKEEEEEDEMALQNQIFAVSRFWIGDSKKECFDRFDQCGISEDLKTLSLRLMKL